MKEKAPISGQEWENNLDAAVSLIQKKETFFFAADLDPDSVGSMLSLSLYLRLLGKKVHMVLAEGLGDGLSFLDKIIQYNSIKVIPSEKGITEIKDQIDMVVFFDTANTKLVPFYSIICQQILSRGLPVIEIDHHFGADSEEMTDNGIKLFRKANANTEIIAELLTRLRKVNPEFPDPFAQRNILLSLLTGILGDTMGGKVVVLEEDFKYWMKTLGGSLESVTRWRKARDGCPADSKADKFSTPDHVFEFMNRLDHEKQLCIDTLTDKIQIGQGVASLNLLDSTHSAVKDVCRPYDSEWFAEVRIFLLNVVPEKSGKIGIVYFQGKNREGEDCIFIKLRRAVDYAGFDLRKTEDEIKKVFSDDYMGGGGHPGAVSFRVHLMEDDRFLAGLDKVIGFIENNVT